MHTRISEQLSDDIRRVADDLRVPVSNLVRNVLEEAFNVAETVTENMGDLIEEVIEDAERVGRRVQYMAKEWSEEAAAAAEEAETGFAPAADGDEPEPDEDPGPPRPEFPDVIGWQPLALNRITECSDCNRPMQRNERAFVGLARSGLSDTFLCRACFEARS